MPAPSAKEPETLNFPTFNPHLPRNPYPRPPVSADASFSTPLPCASMSEQTSQLVHALRRRLRATIRRIGLADLAAGLLLTLGVLAALWLLSVALEAGFWLGTPGRTALFWTVVAVAAGLALYFLVVPLLRLTGVLSGPSEDEVARRIGARYPEVADRLVNLLHLSQGRASRTSGPMLDGAVRTLGEAVEPVPFERVEDFHRARRLGRLASLPLVGLLLFLLAAPTTLPRRLAPDPLPQHLLRAARPVRAPRRAGRRRGR